MSRLNYQRNRFKVAESLYQVFKVALSMYNEWITKDKVVKLRPESLYQVFKVAFCMYQEWITKEKVVKLRSLDIKCLKLRCLSFKSGLPKKRCKVPQSLYQVF